MNFLLVRHAQSLANAGLSRDHDSALTDLGHDQAKRLADYLSSIVGRDEQWIGFVSPFQRALETAFPIHKRFNISFTQRWDIREIEHTVPPSGTTQVTKDRKGFEWVEERSGGHWDYREESREDFLLRTKNFLADLVSVPNVENVIVVSHGMTVLALAEYLTAGDVRWPETWCDQYPNASVTHIVDGIYLLKANDTFLK